MERNTVTTMYHLKIGDRFYKCSDKKKTVWTKVEAETKQTHFQTYKHFGILDGEKYPVAFKSDTQVIFLRHNQVV